MHNNKDFLSIADLPMNHVNDLINIGCSSKTNPNQNILNKKNLVLLFEKPSLRTRVSSKLEYGNLEENVYILTRKMLE